MNFKNLLIGFLTSPFTFGLSFSILMFVISFYYLIYQPLEPHEKPFLYNQIDRIHLGTVDLKLQMRGPRHGHDQIAILAVDDRSIEEIGRWPWPRDKMAEVVEILLSHGSDLIAFDMVFSEKDHNALRSLYKLRGQAASAVPQFVSEIDGLIQKENTDRVFASTIANNSDQVIMGTFFEDAPYNFNAYQDACLNHFFMTTDKFNKWTNEAIPVIALNQAEVFPPDFLYLFMEEISETVHFEAVKRWYAENGGSIKARLNRMFSKPVTDNEITNLLYWWIKAQEDSLKQWLESNRDHLVWDYHVLNLNEHLSQVVRGRSLLTLKASLKKAEFDFCAKWDKYNDDKDLAQTKLRAYWPRIQEKDEEFAKTSVEKAVSQLNDYQESVLENSIERAGSWTMNIADIADGTKHTGYFNAFLDSDGRIRHSNLVVRTGAVYMPSLALKTYLAANNHTAFINIEEDVNNPGITKISKFSLFHPDQEEPVGEIPVDEKGRLLINYAGPRHMYPYVSAADILSNSPYLYIDHRRKDPETAEYESRKIKVRKDEFLKDKIFVAGATAVGVYDLRVTPFDENYPGVETHANVLDNLMRQDFLVIHPEEKIVLPLAVLGIGIALSLALTKLGALWGLIITVLTLIGILASDYFLLFQKGYVISIILPFFLILGVFMSLTVYKYFTEERKKRELKGTFQKYVSPSIVNEILADPTNIELGGRKERMSVFFSDVRGFTTISEKLDPQALSELLNSYLTPMTELVFENKGTLDKYMGDAIMAFFGAPISYPDHARCACLCALQSIQKLNELKEVYERKGLPAIDIGIGINTGEMSVGNMGSETVRNYTVMGDAVNLGSRLEGINKQYGTRIILSEFTYEEIKDDFIAREIDWVRVKGKVLPVKIYELMSERKAPHEVTELVKWFNEGFQLYHGQAFKKASEAFNSALHLRPDDYVSKLYIQRCQEYIDNPPGTEWDGVYTMTSK